MAESKAATITLTQEQFDALLAARGANTGFDVDGFAKAMATANRRENPQAPMVSTFNPKGETANPKPALRCKTFQNGVPLDHDTLLWEEVEALNALPQGEFKVAKANGTRITFKVTHKVALDGETLERVDIHYPCKDEQRWDHRSLLDYCMDVLADAGKEADFERLTKLRREFEAMRRKSA